MAGCVYDCRQNVGNLSRGLFTDTGFSA